MFLKNSILLLSVMAISFTSCKPKKDDPEPVSGFGGNLTIVAKPQHHGAPIIGPVGYPDSAFIKFNTLDFPGDNPALYDSVLVGEEGEDHVHIAGLKPGKMYIFMAGWDSTNNERVSGGIPFNTAQATGELDVLVPVTE